MSKESERNEAFARHQADLRRQDAAPAVQVEPVGYCDPRTISLFRSGTLTPNTVGGMTPVQDEWHTAALYAAPDTGERGQIVAYLRSSAGEKIASHDDPHLEFADAIERGDHLTTDTPEPSRSEDGRRQGTSRLRYDKATRTIVTEKTDAAPSRSDLTPGEWAAVIAALAPMAQCVELNAYMSLTPKEIRTASDLHAILTGKGK